jgi:hypothetical protein
MRHTRSSIYHRRYTNLAVGGIVSNTLQKENSDLVIQIVSQSFSQESVYSSGHYWGFM